ncbi:plasmid mobilization relaxosome protein MobC [Streptococcus iniae]|uniref:plasmid mobilization protein n=1 Tax=Streptococcus iniae TaxID=1346 RepID=UPI00035E4620|nr:plasmid mobilization relaxosome protein MobC [Streptococcus iniae]ESR10522.1 mobilization protein [Streptococcus iniae IUSA1]KYJ81241.1 mobilization protein [Streptococcus iniae]RMI73086.1 plasmid mobilization relaxosome protein MobC [Streptococcus iniae]HEK4517268.1 plasmid mobilization relaxosome protein MobC [Streptococcus iniae]
MEQKNEEKRSRPIQMKVRINESERQLIKRKMAEVNLKNFNTFARYMLTTGKVVTIDYSELTQLRTEINRIGVNINQIVKYINMSEEVSKDDYKLLLESLKDVKQLLVKTIELEQSKGVEYLKEREDNLLGLHET